MEQKYIFAETTNDAIQPNQDEQDPHLEAEKKRSRARGEGRASDHDIYGQEDANSLFFARYYAIIRKEEKTRGNSRGSSMILRQNCKIRQDNFIFQELPKSISGSKK